MCVRVRDLSLGVLANFPRHVMRASDERARNVVVVDGDDNQRNQEVDQEDHDRVDLGVCLIGQWVGDAVDQSHVGVLPLSLDVGIGVEQEVRLLTSVDCAVPCPACWATCIMTTWEKIASGTASRMEKSQMDTAFRQVQKTALEVWMSIGLTMALYLEGKDKQDMEKIEKRGKEEDPKEQKIQKQIATKR